MSPKINLFVIVFLLSAQMNAQTYNSEAGVISNESSQACINLIQGALDMGEIYCSFYCLKRVKQEKICLYHFNTALSSSSAQMKSNPFNFRNSKSARSKKCKSIIRVWGRTR